GADAAFVFAGPIHRGAARELVATVRAELGTSRIAGGLAHGVIGAGREEEGGAGVSVLAVRGLDAQPFWVPELTGGEEIAGEEVAARLAGGARDGDLVVLIPDPRALQPDALLARVRDAAGEAAVVGAGAGDPVSDAPLVWCGAEIGEGALSGMVLRGARARRIGVTQACRPATELLTVTRVQGPWILEVEGRPALEVFREVAREPLADDLRRAAAFVLAALPRDPCAPLAPGGYLVRNIAGFAPDANAFAIPAALEKGDQIALVHREPETAREDLKAMLEGLGAERPGLGLFFDCCARGAGFFGVPGLESAYLDQALGGAPIAGMFGSCELGPIAGRAELLTYTGVLALLDR
ncbi:MAG TPA: FIST N-terminal domain-containing protein, partial [Myxococcota bacterium]|nr:FIST N-terminal domain-containing protein [Myxococcota bacterium]